MKGAPLGQVLALLANIRPGWKGLPGTNAFTCVFGLFVSYEEKKMSDIDYNSKGYKM
jgi:hypothetical protein